MATLQVTLADGQTVEVEGRRFCHYVANIQFWFFLHKSVESSFIWTVTHYDSGKRVLDVQQNSLMACLGDSKAAAKMDLDALIRRAGAERVRSVLAGA